MILAPTDIGAKQISEAKEDWWHDLQEGVIDLRAGTDYSKFPDVYEYLQLVARNLGDHGTALELAERGRCHLDQCMAKGEGLFVPPERYINTPHPTPGPIRYDEAVALQQPHFTANTWAKLLQAHLDDISELARVRLEEDYPDLCDFFRQDQCFRIVKGLGWGIVVTPLNRVSIDCRVLLTNIRAPIPKFQETPPAPHSPEYTELMTELYRNECHPVGRALQEPAYDEAGILAKISCCLAEQGFPVVRFRETSKRFNAPWSTWNEDAELRELKRCEPDSIPIFEERRERERANPVMEYSAFEVWELCAKANRVWCIHDEPDGCCWECRRKPKPGHEEALES
ncbi:hypothetical protein IAT38_004101 [Cryptococcus sp. DSM 104549]